MKSIYFFGTSTTATVNSTFSSSTLSESPGLLASGWPTAFKEYARCNVLLNFGTLVTSTGTITASVQEYFSDIGYVETAKTTIITATGKQWLLSDPGQDVSVNAYRTVGNQIGSFPALGTGYNKQVVFTNSSIQTVGVDVYFVFHKD